MCVFFVLINSASDCLERLVSEMTCYVSSGTLNPTHSLTVQLGIQGSEKLGFSGFWALLDFSDFFYPSEQLGIFLVDLLSFYLDSPLL